jgi:hypothetical protein
LRIGLEATTWTGARAWEIRSQDPPADGKRSDLYVDWW